CKGDVQSIEQLITTTLNSGDDSQLPSMDKLVPGDTEQKIGKLSQDEVAGLMPLLRRCWYSPRVTVRGLGFSLAVSVTLRPDSTKIFEPFVDDLGKLLGDPDLATRRGRSIFWEAPNHCHRREL